MDLGIFYRGALQVSVVGVARGRSWKMTRRQPEPRGALLLLKEA